MRGPVLVTLVVLSAVVFPETQGNWFSGLAGSVSNAVRNVKNFVDRNQGLIRAGAWVVSRGRRGAVEGEAVGPANDKVAEQQLRTKLDTACPSLGIKSTDTISKQVVLEAFAESDDSKDGTLDDDELEELIKILIAYRECIDVESQRK